MRFLGKDWQVVDLLIAVATLLSLILGLIAGLSEAKTRTASLIALGIAGTSLILLLGFRKLRTVYVIYGARLAMKHLEMLASSAKYSIWTVRTHFGEGEVEQGYFDMLHARVIDPQKPLQDARRLIRIGPATGTRNHLYWLIDKFSDREAVKVRYYSGTGPTFDFMIRDDSAAALGLPMAGGEGFAGTVFFSHREVVQGVRDAFEELWTKATPLFNGRGNITSEERQELKEEVDRIIDASQAQARTN